MPSPVEQALHGLLPTVSNIPAPLLELATSLLAQSRSKASSLKPEEEIARTYACCHIACQRLGNKLALDIGRIVPPCGPRIYKRLHAFLNTALRTTSAPATPRNQRVVQTAGSRATLRSGRSTNNPNEASVTSAAPSSARATPTTTGKRGREAPEKAAVELPSYTLSIIKHMCVGQLKSDAAPHVFAGVDTIWQKLQDSDSNKRRRTSARIADASSSQQHDSKRLPGLIIAVFFSVSRKMFARTPGEKFMSQDIPTDGDDDFCDPLLNTMQDSIKGLSEDVFDDITKSEYRWSEDEMREDITFFLAQEEGWREMEWHHNVPDPAPDEDEFEDQSMSDADTVTPRRRLYQTPQGKKSNRNGRSKDEMSCAAGLLPGLGTMFQPAIDWLSEDRMASYKDWREEMLQEIAELGG